MKKVIYITTAMTLLASTAANVSAIETENTEKLVQPKQYIVPESVYKTAYDLLNMKSLKRGQEMAEKSKVALKTHQDDLHPNTLKTAEAIIDNSFKLSSAILLDKKNRAAESISTAVLCLGTLGNKVASFASLSERKYRKKALTLCSKTIKNAHNGNSVPIKKSQIKSDLSKYKILGSSVASGQLYVADYKALQLKKITLKRFSTINDIHISANAISADLWQRLKQFQPELESLNFSLSTSGKESITYVEEDVYKRKELSKFLNQDPSKFIYFK